MRTFYAILLLLAGCSGQKADDPEAAERAEAAALQAELQRAAAAAADPARLEALAARTLPGVMPGAKNLRFRNLRAGSGGAVCGEVAADNIDFRHFVVTSDPVALIAAGPAVAFDDPYDPIADAWIRWCATTDELHKLAPELQRNAAQPIADDVPVPQTETVPLPEALPEPEPVAPAPDRKRPAAAPAAPTRPAEIDSFFNSVDRPGR